jgi:uncharacterized protein DUF3883
MPRNAAWSHADAETVVRAYAEMLERELRGEPIVKAEFNRRIQRETGRSRASIEFKFRNVSAAFTELGYASVRGYLPAFNYQHSLLALSANVLADDSPLREAMASAATESTVTKVNAASLQEVSVPPRRPGPAPRRLGDAPPPVRIVNWLEVEARNAARGRFGEQLVVEWEDRRLRGAGAKALASRIEHVSATQGDGIGFDIRSFEPDGSDRLIEVKTTRFGEYTPFFASANEVSVSADLADTWHLYRVFDVQRRPKFFSRQGALAERFALDPVQFRARVA